MLLVKTYLAPSKIHGIGLFAAEFIPKSTPTWRFQEGFDLAIGKEDMKKLSEPSKEQFQNYAYLNQQTGKYVLCFDDSRFMNHSSDPNTKSSPSDNDEDVAVRDIQKGEEITTDYREFDTDSKEGKLGYVS